MNQDLSGNPGNKPTANFAEIEAAIKRMCGTCSFKEPGQWVCTHPAEYPCPNGSHSLSLDPKWVCPGFLMKHTIPPFRQVKMKGLPVPPGVKLLYFGHRSILMGKHMGALGHHGVVTVAWIEPTPGTLHLGFSFCSPKDPRRKIGGRDIALTRLLHPVVIPFLYSPRRTVHEVTRAIMSHDFVRLAAIAPGVTMWGMIPSWTKDLAKKVWPPHRRTKLLIWNRIRPLTHAADAMGYLMGNVPFMSVERRTRPRPSPLDILTRMATDIAGLGRAAD